jgi:ribulose-5-phosphate 4-epimerase/fuculose-1-phosphate aldolase
MVSAGGLFVIGLLMLYAGRTSAEAQVNNPPVSAQKATLTAADPASIDQIEELVRANRILAHYGVLDAYGHVSVRSTRNPKHFFLARHIPASTVTANDIIEYDIDTKPVFKTNYVGYSERFIHGEILKARPDVNAVVHGHAADIVTFTIAQVPLRAVSHMGAFLGPEVPVFDTRSMTKDGEMLIRNNELGRGLAVALGQHPAVLIRGHGAVVVADSLHVVTGRAYYMTINAHEQMQAMQLPGSKLIYLEPNETDKMAMQDGFERFWEMGKRAIEDARTAR